MTGAAIPWWGWLLLAVVGAVYGLFEYVRRNVPALALTDDDCDPGIGELNADIVALRAKLSEIAEDRKAIIRDYQNLAGLEARVSDMVDALKDSMKERNAVIEDRFFINERVLREFREKVLKSNAQLFLALKAIKARETERFYAAAIQEHGERLQEKVRNNQPFRGNDWADWQLDQAKMESAMYHWLQLSDGWHPSVREWINDVKPESLTSLDWGEIDELFEKSGQVITYKTQISKYDNWMRLRNHVALAIHHAAFGGPDADEILQYIPGGGPSVEKVKEKLDAKRRGETLRQIVEGNGGGAGS